MLCASPLARGLFRGANHASEMPYVYGMSWGRPFQGGDKAVSDAMNRYWANFVKTGDPNGEGLDVWPVYEDGENTVMFFKNVQYYPS